MESRDRDYLKGIARILTYFSGLYQLAPTVCRRAHKVALDRHSHLESISSCGQSIPMLERWLEEKLVRATDGFCFELKIWSP